MQMHTIVMNCTDLYTIAHNSTDLQTVAHNRLQADTSEHRKTQAGRKILYIVFCRRLHYVYVFVYEFVFVFVFEYEYVHVLVHVHDYVFVYECAGAPFATSYTKTEIKKKCIGLFKKRLTISTTCNIVIYVSDRTFILCVVE